VRNAAGNIIGVALFSKDITKRKRAEEELLINHEKLRKTLNDAIGMMSKMAEMRDPYTAGHQRRVAHLATTIAEELKFGNIQMENLHIAAVIHDIGKMYVPSEILSKPGKLSDIEFGLIKTHAQAGYDIVKSMDFPCIIAQSILQHHERLDGSGYPNNLKGDDISQEAKIMAVADVVEAIASHRPYRAALSIDKALEELTKNRGKLYDPEVVDTCLNVFSEKGFKFQE
jgi:putative nucleotidyltransferase with HDIG domain